MIQRLYDFHFRETRTRVLVFGCILFLALLYACVNSLALGRSTLPVSYETAGFVVLLMVAGPLLYAAYGKRLGSEARDSRLSLSSQAEGTRPLTLVARRLAWLVLLLGLAAMSGGFLFHLHGNSFVDEAFLTIAVGGVVSALYFFRFESYLHREVSEQVGDLLARLLTNDRLGRSGIDIYASADTGRHESVDLIPQPYRLYANRRQAMQSFLSFIKEEQQEIFVMGLSLHGLIEEPEYSKSLRRRSRAGVNLRFLVSHPLFADFRASQENRPSMDVNREIVGNLRTLIQDWGVDRGNIRLFRGMPTCFAIKTTGAILLNIYPYVGGGSSSPSIIVLNQEPMYHEIAAQFFGAWQTNAAEAIDGSIDELESRLEDFSEAAQRVIAYD